MSFMDYIESGKHLNQDHKDLKEIQTHDSNPELNRVSKVALNKLESDLALLEEDDTVCRKMIMEKKQELEFLLSEFQALQEIMQDFSQIVEEQGEGLDQVESNIEKAAEKTLEADKELKVAVKEVKKGRRGKVGLVVGAGAGGALGLLGFAINPVVGLATVAICGALGTGVGGVVGMTTK